MAITWVREFANNPGDTQVETFDLALEITGDDRYLIASIGIRNLNPVVTAAFDPLGANVAMTSIITVAHSTSSTSNHVFGLVAPALSASATIRFTWTGAAHVTAGTGLMTGVDQTTPLGTSGSAEGNVVNPSVSVTAATDDMIVGILVNRDGTITVTPAAALTQRWNSSAGTSSRPRTVGATRLGTGGSTAVDFTNSATNGWALTATPFNAAAAAAGPAFVHRARTGGRWL